MFENWGFLVGELWFLIALAVAMGFAAGWFLRSTPDDDRNHLEMDRLHNQLDAALAGKSDAEAEVAFLSEAVRPADHHVLPALEPQAEAGALEPTFLDAARDDGADNLRKIKGVGPKLENTLNELGVYHFDQIAAWTAEEIAWVDENLGAFKGRVSRDNWSAQAQTLAAGLETGFSKKVGN